jgi:hypothetical protein
MPTTTWHWEDISHGPLPHMAQPEPDEALIRALVAICHAYYDSSIGSRAERAKVMREMAAIALSQHNRGK